jgi:O-antigen ligase
LPSAAPAASTEAAARPTAESTGTSGATTRGPKPPPGPPGPPPGGSPEPISGIASTAQRLTYWRKSIKFLAEAPLLGHGTGSIKAQFTRDAAGQTGLEAEVVSNPHNQTLAVAVQWGLLGVMLLYAMWLNHLLLFTGRTLAAWVGLVVVVQNVVSSLLNSHLFDFHEGWIYVLGVGIAGGMSLRTARRRNLVFEG